MMDISLTALARSRISLHPRTGLRFEPDGSLSQRTIGRPQVAKRYISIEAVVPTGALNDYGLLAVSYEPHQSGELRLDVGYKHNADAKWLSSLAAMTDDVRVGLPEEYSQAVMDGLLSSTYLGAPSGVVVVTEAAHGRVGSSPIFFKKLAVACAEIVFWNDARLTEHVLGECLRSKLTTAWP
jgi:hypothetical protein